MTHSETFTYIFDDEKWMGKVLGGSLCMLVAMIPLLGIPGSLVFMGYLKRLSRNVIDGVPKPLPEWDDLGGDFVEGAKTLLINIVYMLPVVVLYFGVFIVAMIMGEGGAFEGSDEAGAVMGCFLVGIWLLVMALILICSVLLTVATLRFYATDSLGSAFQIGEVIRLITRRPGGFLVAYLLFFVAVFAGQLGILACIIGFFFTMPIGMFVGWTFLSNFYRDAVAV